MTRGIAGMSCYMSFSLLYIVNTYFCGWKPVHKNDSDGNIHCTSTMCYIPITDGDNKIDCGI